MIGAERSTLAHLPGSWRQRGLENDRDPEQALIGPDLVQMIESAAIRHQAIENHEIECRGRILQDFPGILQIFRRMKADSRLGAEIVDQRAKTERIAVDQKEMRLDHVASIEESQAISAACSCCCRVHIRA